MKQDELLSDLGRLARAQAEQTAAREADADELFRPLDAAAQQRIVARLLPLVQPAGLPEAASTPDASRAPRDTTGTAATPAGAQPRSAAVIPLRSRPRRWLMAAAPALAAAAVLLWFVWPRAGAPLPVYALELSGGRAAQRGADTDGILRVGPGDRVSAVLRPATPVHGAVGVRVFVNGRALPDAGALSVEQSSDGALRISGLGPALTALAPGRHRLQLAVGRPETLPEALSDALPSPPAAAGDGVQLLSYEVERLPP
jgi:hypothetical protein